jgi:hypothetical protein
LVKIHFCGDAATPQDCVRDEAIENTESIAMRAFKVPVYALTLVCVIVGASVALHAQEPAHVSFPEKYRSWQLVKSIVVGPECSFFAARGGIHNYYANTQAVEGYQTGKFPDGSVIVDEANWMKDGEGLAKGIWMENGVRFLEVMSKDAQTFKESDGWGYERFEGNSRTGELGTEAQGQCHSCHANAKERDLVFSSLRP